jgi:threonyl-tRNA synthetase
MVSPCPVLLEFFWLSISGTDSSSLRPFWISPRQVLVVPVAGPHKDYASEVTKKLWDAGLWADADLSDSTLPKKIRNGEISQYNFILGGLFFIVFIYILRC